MANKLKKQKNNQKTQLFDSVIKQIQSVVIGFFILITVILFPLYYRDAYNQIGEVKFLFFRNIALFSFGIMSAVALVYLAGTLINNIKEKKAIKWDELQKQVSLTDYAVLAYLILTFLSYIFCEILSGYGIEAFWGYPGWNMGLMSQIFFVLIYYFISRYWKFDSLFFAVMLFVAFIIFVIGVLHRFQIDPLGVYTGLDPVYRKDYVSTLGNINWYSSYLAILLPFGAFFYWRTNYKVVRILTGVYLTVAFASIVTQNSDSAFLGVFAFLIVMFWFSFVSNAKMLRFLEIILIMLGSFKIIGILQLLMPERTAGLGALSYFMSKSIYTWIIFAVFLLLYMVFYYFVQKRKFDISRWLKVRKGFYIAVFAGIILLLVYICLNTMGLLPENLRTGGYLLFDDNWGTKRGFNWKITLSTFSKMSPVQMLFGAGPDCFAYVSNQYHAAEYQAVFGNVVATNAHNEWLTIFINGGIFGALAYIGIFLTAFKRYAAKIKEQPFFLAVCACIAGYMAHNLFCYQQIICTPFIFIIIGMGELAMRKTITGEPLEE